MKYQSARQPKGDDVIVTQPEEFIKVPMAEVAAAMKRQWPLQGLSMRSWQRHVELIAKLSCMEFFTVWWDWDKGSREAELQ
jgi:hypothetical protein